MFLILSTLFAACVIHGEGPGSGGLPTLSCDDVVVRATEGGPDLCDLAACYACVTECGERCAVQESYPPRYVCPGDAWDVYDRCPTWGEEESGEPVAAAVVDLGCGTDSGESLSAASSTSGRIEVTHLDYGLGCCPQSVEVSVLAAGSTLAVAYEPVNDMCECACMLDVSYTILNVPAGTWTLTAGELGVSTVVTVP